MAIPMLLYGSRALPYLLRQGLVKRVGLHTYKFTDTFDVSDMTTPNPFEFPSYSVRRRFISTPYGGLIQGRRHTTYAVRPRRDLLNRAHWSSVAPIGSDIGSGSVPYQSVNLRLAGDIVFVKRQLNYNRRRDEANRPRQDKKVPGRYAAFLRFVNRTWGTYSEMEEFAEAWSQSATLYAVVEALFYNEMIDRVYGTRMNLLKRHVYSKSFYTLPIGLDALSNAWRHF